MARDPKTAIEKAMPGYRLVEPAARPRGLDDRGDDNAPPPADVRGPDFAKLQELYLGRTTTARPRSALNSGPGQGSKLFTVEKETLMDAPAVGRKAVIFDEDDDKIVGKQG